MARITIFVQRKKKAEDGIEEPNWESMGVDRPKVKSKTEIYYVERYIHTADIEYTERYTKDETIIKCVWSDNTQIIKTDYDEFNIQLDDLENDMIIDDLPE